jgi:iron complex transport system ATP-binding protein
MTGLVTDPPAMVATDALLARDLIVRRGGCTVLDRVELTARRGTTVGIIGPNGAGKSSLLLALYRAIPRAAGEVIIDGVGLDELSRREIARTIAIVGQDNEMAMPLSVRDSVGLGRLPHRSLVGYGDVTDRELVTEALGRVGLSDLADRLLTELSGGERQRALIARAIVQDPSYLFLDEPTNHLDLHHQFALLALVKTVSATTVTVLHDLNLAARACQELVLLANGRLVASGPSADVLQPDLIAEVYQVGVHVVEHRGRRHLIFDPAPAEPGADTSSVTSPGGVPGEATKKENE